MGNPGYDADPLGRISGTPIGTLADGDGVTLDCRLLATLTIITGSGCTATYSRVDSATASSHTSSVGTENGDTIAASTRLSIPTDWAFIRLSAAGGSLRYSLT